MNPMDEDLNRRTALKAAIKRATIESQGRAYALDEISQEQLRQIYQRAHDDIVARIHAAGGSDGIVGLGRLRQLKADLEARIQALGQERNGVLLENLKQASANGTTAFTGVLEAHSLFHIADAAVRQVRSFVDENGLQLSDKLWRLDLNATRKVTDAVQQAVIRGYGASQAVQEFLGRGETVPPELLSKMRAAHAPTVAKAAGAGLLADEGNAYAHAQRVFRTEINRAHGNAYQAAAAQVTGIVGTKFNLSPQHPRRDICDMYASANLYGLGPGVYPHGKSPWPAHPNTLSFETVVFEDEVSAEHRAGKTTPLKWLKDQSYGMQSAVLGGDAKAAALRADHLTTGMIRAPWYSVKAKLEKKGVDVSKLTGQGD